MKHLKNAQGNSKFISVKDNKVTFEFQDGVVGGEDSRPGCQVIDILEFTSNLVASLNEAHPCDDNNASISFIAEAIHHQNKRTEDREARSVEGTEED